MNRRNPAGRLRAGLRDPSPPLTLPGNRSSVEGKPPGKWGDKMLEEGASSLLRRIGTPAVLFCLAFAAPANAASPSPDPPPLGVAPEAPHAKPARPRAPAPASTRTVATQAPVVVRTVEQPVYVVREVPAEPARTQQPARAKPVAKSPPKPKPNPTPKAAAKPKRKAVLPPAPPHDRSPVPLATFIPTVEELDRGLLALAGAGLAFVALGGAVMLAAARRQLEGLAR